MKERLQKIIAARGVCSRRAAEELIKAGRVTCNGFVCALGESADPDTDVILLDGNPLPSGGEKVYLMLHKPRGYVTTLSDEKGRKNVSELVKTCGTRVYPVGRLDMDSEGLLLLTNDGEFANALMHPSHEVNKVYDVWVRGFREDSVARLSQSVVIDGYRIKKPTVVLVHRMPAEGEALLQITIHEGRNRQIRKMCALADMRVFRLKRIAEGSLDLGDLALGKWRYLTDAEVASLKK